MYNKLAGMTGTAATEEGEFSEIYDLDVVIIPTNEPVIRDDKEDLVFRTKREKYNAAIEKIEEYHEKGQPVLVGTTNVDVSETISRMLKRENIPHNVLNAKQHAKESDIVENAGQPGAVTVATNMAGRGTDIKLAPGVKEKGDWPFWAPSATNRGASTFSCVDVPDVRAIPVNHSSTSPSRMT
ncbi:MAG: hypothetical protein U5J63_18315 [Fodinibius sp.]|nr:hypothetical protein [Fodinibius sp.]